MIDYIQIGDMGKNRNRFFHKVSQQVGKGNWFLGFRAGQKLYSWAFGMQLYEDAYWSFLREDIEYIKELVGYSDVFVYNRHDADSCLNYKEQTQESDHYQGIAIRRCLVRMGVWFKGEGILKIPETKFNDCKIPFHLPHLINKPDSIGSIKSWIDTNRLVIVAPEIEDKAKLAELMVK